MKYIVLLDIESDSPGILCKTCHAKDKSGGPEWFGVFNEAVNAGNEMVSYGLTTDFMVFKTCDEEHLALAPDQPDEKQLTLFEL